MATVDIQYRFNLAEGHTEVVDVVIDDQSLENVNIPQAGAPAWTRLDFHQCPHCPLTPDSRPHCPVAEALIDIASRFEEIASYAELDVEVISAERTVTKRTTAQRAISSLLGLLFATSGCPHTLFLKPMARFHLPLASEEDTIFRAAGMYMLAQYFRGREGRPADLDLACLTTIFQNLHEVNVEVAKRLRSVFSGDSSINAIILLDMFTSAMPFVIKDQLAEIRHLFAPYLDRHFDDVCSPGKGDKHG